MALAGTTTLKQFGGSTVITIGSLLISNALDVEAPLVVNITRALYAVVALGTFAAYGLVLARVARMEPDPANPDAFVIAYFPKGRGGKPDTKKEPTVETVAEYDRRAARRELASYVVSALVVVGLHVFFASFTPIFVAALSQPAFVAESKVVRAHLRGASSMPRPYPEDPSWGEAMAVDVATLRRDLASGDEGAAAGGGTAPADAYRRLRERAEADRLAALGGAAGRRRK